MGLFKPFCNQINKWGYLIKCVFFFIFMSELSILIALSQVLTALHRRASLEASISMKYDRIKLFGFSLIYRRKYCNRVIATNEVSFKTKTNNNQFELKNL